MTLLGRVPIDQAHSSDVAAFNRAVYKSACNWSPSPPHLDVKPCNRALYKPASNRGRRRTWQHATGPSMC
eukprot:316856-Chlamydomonas_euryale.AAC.2